MTERPSPEEVLRWTRERWVLDDDEPFGVMARLMLENEGYSIVPTKQLEALRRLRGAAEADEAACRNPDLDRDELQFCRGRVHRAVYDCWEAHR